MQPASSAAPLATPSQPVGTRNRHRRPSGEPPPLPHNLASAWYWLGLTVLGLVLGVVLKVTGAWVPLTHADVALLRRIATLRSEPATAVALALHALGSQWTVRVLMWATVAIAVAFKRWRHLVVLVVAQGVVQWFSTAAALTIARPRPSGVIPLAAWNGFSMPSRPVAALSAALVGLCYTAIPAGRRRTIAKRVAAGLVLALAFARLYLGIDHPSDVFFGVMLGVTVPLAAFRLLVPNAIFPVTYRRSRSAHLLIDDRRMTALKVALRDQLGVVVRDLAPFNLEGSFGSTPLRIEVEDGTVLFGKLYAASHMRADRWYKLWRTLRYGRLEDEKAFNTVRRLVQYEDYLLRVMHDAGLPVATPYGFVEITPEREYLLVTEFVAGGRESGKAEIDEAVIDDALGVVRRMWVAGVAHRDIKPANVLVRDGGIVLIDVAFGQVRPSPWREAVDLANMMIVLALRCSPELVYERALRVFSPEEVAEAFAATSEATRPSLHRMLRSDGRDLLGAFRRLAPPQRRIRIQRWSARRVGLTALVLVGGLILAATAVGNVVGAGAFDTPVRQHNSSGDATADREYALRGLAGDRLAPRCTDVSNSLLLMAQTVPDAALLPCVASLPAGWALSGLDLRSGGTTLWFDSDRAGTGALVVELRASCDLSGAEEIPSDEGGTRRYQLLDPAPGRNRVTRFSTFEGGCVTYRFDFPRPGWTALANDAANTVDFISRERVAQAYGEITRGLEGP